MLLALIIQTTVVLTVTAQKNLTPNGTATQSSAYNSNDVSKGKPENAVNPPISNKYSLDNCSSTRLADRDIDNAWWMFHFSNDTAYITDITIYYRENYARRMGGFQLYVTNTSTIPPNGHLCYGDIFSVGGPYPDITQTISCNQLGEYVIYYDDKGSDEGGKIRQPIVELCYVAINDTCNIAEEGSDIGAFQLLLEDEREDLHLEEVVPKEKDNVDSRFRPVENGEVDAQSKPYIPANTIKKANWAKNMYNSWRLGAILNAEEEERLILQKDLLGLTDAEIISLFPKFIMSVRRKDCGEYKSDIIFSIITSIQKYYEINGKNISLLSDIKFNSIKNCVSNTMREKVQKGIGLFKRQAQVIPKETETMLWENGFLGYGDPETLFHTIFWITCIGINFGLRGGQEHRDLSMENFRLETADNGEQVLVYRETVSKTYRGGLDHRNIEPHTARAFQNRQQPDRCPVHIFNTYITKLPSERAKEAFYFQPLACYKDKPVWFSKQPVGKNKLEVVVKTVMGKAGIDGFYTNHSLRSTTATRLFNANIPEQLIREQTGHRSNALWSYSRPSEPQKRKVSEILQLNEDSCTSIGPTVSKQVTNSSSPTAAKQATTISAESVPSFVFNNSNINIYFSK